MNRAEAEKAARWYVNPCSGPILIGDESIRNKYHNRLDVSLGRGNLADLLAMKDELEELIGVPKRLRRPPELEPKKLASQVFRLITARRRYIGDPCGVDLFDLVVRYPFNGKVHETACPGCGRFVHFRSPIMDVEDDLKEEN